MSQLTQAIVVFLSQSTASLLPGQVAPAGQIAIVEPERPTHVERGYAASCGRNRLSLSVNSWKRNPGEQLRSIAVDGRQVPLQEKKKIIDQLLPTAWLYEASVEECTRSDGAIARIRLFFLADPTEAKGARSADFWITAGGRVSKVRLN